MTNVAIELNDVAVQYRVPTDPSGSLKEFAIRAVKGQLQMRTFMALEGINLQVERGSTVGIIGHNGAGKSTLLKVVSRVLRPTRGRVRVQGQVAPLLELGAGFDMELTGRENIFLNGAILGFSRADLQRRFDRIVEFSGLATFIDAPLRTYSSGMVVRLGFAVATDIQPEILIVDEVLGVGDAEFQTRSRERIESFAGSGSTILMVSHNATAVTQMCDRAIWLDHGRMMAEGTAEWVLAQYGASVREQQSEALLAANAAPVETPQSRWGTGQVVINAVRVLNEDGIACALFRTGDRLVIEMDYTVNVALEEIVFGLAVHRQDGVHVTGPNTHNVHLTIAGTVGQGTVRYEVDHLPLLDGLFQVSVAVVDGADFGAVLDYHDRQYQFRVANPEDSRQERYGMMTLRGRWAVQQKDPGVRVRTPQ